VGMRDDAPLPTGTRVVRRQQGGGRRWGTIEAFDRNTMTYRVVYDSGAWADVAWADVRLVRAGCAHEVLELSREERMAASQWAARSEKFLQALAEEAYLQRKQEMQRP